MTTNQQLLEQIEASPNGPEIAAIFDFDRTLIAGYSATLFVKEQIRRRDLSVSEFLEQSSAMINFSLGKIEFSDMLKVTTEIASGTPEQTFIDIGDKLYNEQIAGLIYPESRALVQAHLAKGHTVAVISSATPYQVEPAARELGIPHILCSHLEIKDGILTGNIIDPPCFGEGKVIAAENLATQTGADLDKSFFYSDSQDDLELLERVGHPQLLNPTGKLQAIAKDKGWDWVHFHSRGQPTVSEILRSAAATASMPASMLAALPIWSLSGSRDQAVNFAKSLWGDVASAFIGLDLNVKGEHHLWSHRPAIFLINHQSKVDTIIAAKLIRRDFAGIGKQEIRDVPILGKVMEFAGTVFIDRANAASAIEAMAPLVDVIKTEGKSVVIAPEGTRSISPQLGSFKKGPFHLAVQSGAPVVPVVIRNSGDVSPKGDFVMRKGTVDVDVLAPIDTSDWSADTIDQHVQHVRKLFLESLGQQDKQAESSRRAKPKRSAASRKTAKKPTKKKPQQRKAAK